MKKVLGILGASLMAASVLTAAPAPAKMSRECGCPTQYCKCSSACQCGDNCTCGSKCNCK